MMSVQDLQRAKFIGAKNRAQGETLEMLIAMACGFYKAKGLAHIEKTPEPMKVLRRLENGQFVACFAKKAQPDFQGTLSSGRAVMFEAKSTRTGCIEQSEVSKAQADYLDAHMAMNALCFVVVSYGDVFAAVPWGEWKRMKEIFGHKYMTREESQRYRIKFNRNGILDFFG